MKIKKLSNATERLILIGLIVSKEFIQRFEEIYTDPEFFPNDWSRNIAHWCIDYYERYKKAPEKDIEKISQEKISRIHNEETQEMITRFLHSLSREYERMETYNAEYALDRCVEFFRERSIELLVNDLQVVMEKDDLQTAETIIGDFLKVEKVLDESIEPFKYTEIIPSLFQRSSKSIVEFSGKLGMMLNPILKEGRFVAFLAPEKTGKSYFIDEILIRGASTRSNVCVFDAGDLTKEDRMERYIQYATIRPMKKEDGENVLYPVLDCKHNQDNTCNRKERVCRVGIYEGEMKLSPQEIPKRYKNCRGCKDAFHPACLLSVRQVPPLNTKEAAEGLTKFRKRFGGSRFKLSCHSNSTLTFDAIERQLDRWERNDGFIPNIVAIDYMDLLVPEKSMNDSRAIQDYLWKRARKISQERNVLLLSATQANQSSYYKGKQKEGDLPDSRKGIRRYHISEDKRKLAHASAIVGLSQTPEDAEECIIKVNVVINRHGKCREDYCVKVAGCLALSRPFLFSF